MFINIGKYLYTIIYVLLIIIISMMFLSYFNISFKPNNNANITLTRAAVFEGYNKNNNNNDDDVVSGNFLLQNL